MNLRPLANSSVLFVGLVYGFLMAAAGLFGLLGTALSIFLWLSIWRYSYVVLRTVAQGRSFIPAPDIDSMNPVAEWRLVLHFLLFGSAFVLIVTTPLIGDGAGATALRWLAALVLLGVFPASAALLSFTLSPAVALSPSSIAAFVQTMGSNYLRLLAACAGLVLAVAFVQSVVGGGFLASIAGSILGIWCMLATFALIGGAVREHRADFDIPGERIPEAEQRAAERERERRNVLDRAYASIRGGLPAEGYRTIKELLAAENDVVDAYQWVFKEMLEWEDRAHALGFASRFIERLLKDGNDLGALDVFAQCRRLQREFSVPNGAAARLAGYARTIGRHRMADELEELSPRAQHL